MKRGVADGVVGVVQTAFVVVVFLILSALALVFVGIGWLLGLRMPEKD